MASSSDRRALAADVSLREVWAWSMYDFANSGYTTVVITAVFSAYFVGAVAHKAPWAALAWPAALSLSYLLTILTAPPIGAWADAHAAKKQLLFLSTVGCVVFTAGLWFAAPGAVVLALVLVGVSNYFFSTGENLIAAFLPELASSHAMGRVSGWGWAFGYLGGLVSLGACLAYISWASARGQSAAEFVPATMVITAVLFAVFAAPTFLFLKERAQPQPNLESPWARLLRTFHESARFADLRRFLVCILFYQAGIMIVIQFAAIYAQQVMHFSQQQTIVLILVVNVTAAVGAFAFGYLQDAIGHMRSMVLILLGWIVMIGTAYYADDTPTFWVAANLAGLCMGSSQAAGRAVVGFLSPRAREAEFFGLWGFAVKAASIVGPLTYGGVVLFFAGNYRIGILTAAAYFVIGLALLAGIDIARGRKAALLG